MRDHLARKKAVRELCDRQELAEAIERCNLRPEMRQLLRVLYLDGGCIDDVCAAVGREYTTVAKWHRAALAKLVFLLQKQGKI